jgi:chemotaxis protein CheD
VSVTVFSHASKLGGICHAMLPSGGLDEGFKFVDSTLDYMMGRINQLGIDLAGCEVKLFGGADVLLLRGERGEKMSVGMQNILAARCGLDKYGIIPAASDVGGTHGRRIYFDTQTGHVYLKMMRKTVA